MTTPLAQSPPAAGSSFLEAAINKELERLRADCAVKRECKRNAFGRRWAFASRSTKEMEADFGSSDKYWDDLQNAAKIERTAEEEASDKALADFIAEHRVIMGKDWIGNDHGRLCWAPYCGGMPIDQHYCQRAEGHDGNHADEWPETRFACNSPRGSWPQGVTGDREWRALIDRKNDKMEQPPLTKNDENR